MTCPESLDVANTRERLTIKELSRLADSSAAIKNMIIDHGIKRKTGKNKGVTWNHVLTSARQFARA